MSIKLSHHQAYLLRKLVEKPEPCKPWYATAQKLINLGYAKWAEGLPTRVEITDAGRNFIEGAK